MTLTSNVNDMWQCDACMCKNKLNDFNCIECNASSNVISIRVTAGGDVSSFLDFRIKCSYSASTTIQDLLNKALFTIHQECSPKVYYIEVIYDGSFIGKNVLNSYKNQVEWNTICSKSLKEYNKNQIISKGLRINIKNKYIHKPNKQDITCQHINNYYNNINNIDQKTNHNTNNNTNNTIDPLKCPIYKSMIIDNQFTTNNLKHLDGFTHFKDEYNDKKKCQFDIKCPSFIRLENGSNSLSDICHLKLYNHPPRSDRSIKLGQNINAFVYNSNNQQNQAVYRTTDNDYKQYQPFNDIEVNKGNGNPGYINALIEEVVRNGFQYDLCVTCGANDNCNHNDYSLLKVVDQKYHHKRHQQIGYRLSRGELLALILYTGCDCNYDLCSNQRNGNYNKWIWFDYCLFQAVKNLSGKEQGLYKLYSGLSKVKLDKKRVISGYFPTFTSSSWNKKVALFFMKNNPGMIIEIDEQYRNKSNVLCCDVSWISKFQDECEILISRSVGNSADDNGFTLSILDESFGIQTVGLKQRQKTKQEQLLDLFGDQLAQNPDLMKLLYQ